MNQGKEPKKISDIIWKNAPQIDLRERVPGDSFKEPLKEAKEEVFVEKEELKPKKISKKDKFKIPLLIFLVLLIGFIIFSHFYFNHKMKEILSIPSFEQYKIPEKEVEEIVHSEVDPKIRDFGLKIEKLGILAPVIAQVDGSNERAYNEALEKGIAHFQGTSLPEGESNIFLFGHSSTATGQGPYAKIFARLGELEKEDKIIVFYKDKEYLYSVFEKKVVEDTEVSVLFPTQKEQLTLMTCWPIGTDKQRLIIKAVPVE